MITLENVFSGCDDAKPDALERSLRGEKYRRTVLIDGGVR